MRAFSYIAVIGSLALATFTSAAPQPVVVENGIVARDSYTGSSCDGCNYIQGVIDKLDSPCSSITGGGFDNGSPDVAGLTKLLNEIISVVEGVISELKSNHQLLNGLDYSTCANLLGKLIQLILGVVNTVLGLLSSCSADDQGSLKALLTTLFSLVGDLVCLVLSIVVSLLGTVLSLVGQLLGTLSGLVDCTSVLNILTDCQSHWPAAVGGTIPQTGLQL